MAVKDRKGGRRHPWAFDHYEELPDGAKKRRTQFFRTKGEAKAAEQLWLKRKPHGRPNADPSSTVAECADRFLRVAAAVKEGNTYLCYETNLHQHILPAFGRRKMRDFDRGVFKEFLAKKLTEPVIRNGRELRAVRSPNSVRAIFATGSALAGFAVDEGILPANPFHRLGKSLKLAASRKARQTCVRKKAMTRDQLARFLAAVQEMAPRRWPLFFLLARTGLRINEALALRMTDLHLETGELRVERERARNREGRWTLQLPKSDHGIRTVRLSAQLASAIRRWTEVERAKDKLRHGWAAAPPWLFYADCDPAAYDPTNPVDGTLDDGNVRRVMRAVLRALHDADRKAGARPEECFPQHFTPHSFRHSFASLLLSEGKDLQLVRQQLGHESIKLTADTYGGWLDSTATNANDCLDDPNWHEASHHGG